MPIIERTIIIERYKKKIKHNLRREFFAFITFTFARTSTQHTYGSLAVSVGDKDIE